jgi:hypothetical protein
MIKKVFLFVLAISILAAVPPAQAQQPKVSRIGVVTAGGAWYEVIDGLRVGLGQLGLEEGKQFILAIQDTKAMRRRRRRRQGISKKGKST